MPAHPIPRPLRGMRAALLVGCVALPLLLWWVRGRALEGFYLADDFGFLRTGYFVSDAPTLQAIWMALWPEQLLEGNPKQYWRPLFSLSVLADQQMFGTAAGPRFLLHLFLCGLGGLGLALWLRGLGARPMTAALAAALYGVHPLLGEMVHWLAARDMLLATGFLLLGQGLLATALRRWRRRRRATGMLWAAAGCQGLAMMGQEGAIVGVPVWLVTLWSLRPHAGVIPWLLRWSTPVFAVLLGWALVRGALFGWDQVLDFWNEELASRGAFRPEYSLWYRLGAVRAALLPVHWGIEHPWRAVPGALALLLFTLRGACTWRHHGRRPLLLAVGSLGVLGLFMVLWVPCDPDTLMGSRSTAPWAAASAALAALGVADMAPAGEPGWRRWVHRRPLLRTGAMMLGAGAMVLVAGAAAHHNDTGYVRAGHLSRDLHGKISTALMESAPGGRVYVADIPRLAHGAVFRLAPLQEEPIGLGPPLRAAAPGPRLRRFRPQQGRAWLEAMADLRPNRDRALRFDPVVGAGPAQSGEVQGLALGGGRLRGRVDRVAVRQGSAAFLALSIHYAPGPVQTPLLPGPGGATLTWVDGDGSPAAGLAALPVMDALGTQADQPLGWQLQGREAPGLLQLMLVRPDGSRDPLALVEVLPSD